MRREQEERKTQKRGGKARALAEHGVKPEEGGAGNARGGPGGGRITQSIILEAEGTRVGV